MIIQGGKAQKVSGYLLSVWAWSSRLAQRICAAVVPWLPELLDNWLARPANRVCCRRRSQMFPFLAAWENGLLSKKQIEQIMENFFRTVDLHLNCLLFLDHVTSLLSINLSSTRHVLYIQENRKSSTFSFSFNLLFSIFNYARTLRRHCVFGEKIFFHLAHDRK